VDHVWGKIQTWSILDENYASARPTNIIISYVNRFWHYKYSKKYLSDRIKPSFVFSM